MSPAAVTLAALVLLLILVAVWFFHEKRKVAAAFARWGESAVPDCFQKIVPTCGPMFAAGAGSPPAMFDNSASSRFAVGIVARFIASLTPDSTGWWLPNGRVKLIGYAPDLLPLAAVWPASESAAGVDSLRDRGGPRATLVAFRGTISAADLAADAKYYERGLGDGTIRVHGGMYSVYLAARDQLFSALPSRGQIFVAGHSLGAAVAFYFAREAAIRGYDVEVVGIAPPRAGNPAFAEDVSRVTRHALSVINEADVVPTLPWTYMPDFAGTARHPRPPTSYAHVEPVAIFSNRGPDAIANHGLPAYFAGLAMPDPLAIIPADR